MFRHAKDFTGEPEVSELSSKRACPAPQLIDGAASAISSPVHDLQSRLANELGGARAGAWSPRRTLAFITITSSAFWAALAYCIHSWAS